MSVLLLVLLLLASVATADQLQYHATTLQVTGYRRGAKPVAPVAERVVVDVPDGFLATIPQPPGCNFVAHQYPHAYRVTVVDPLTVVAEAPECFDAQPVYDKGGVDLRLTERLRVFQRSHFAFCPADDVTPQCNRIRAKQRLPQQDLNAIDVLYQQADDVKGRLP